MAHQTESTHAREGERGRSTGQQRHHRGERRSLQARSTTKSREAPTGGAEVVISRDRRRELWSLQAKVAAIVVGGRGGGGEWVASGVDGGVSGGCGIDAVCVCV